MSILNWLLFAGYDRKVYDEIKDGLLQTNRTRLITFSIFFSAACFVMSLLSFFVPNIAGMRFSYITYTAVMLIILFVAKRYGNHERLILQMIYLFVAIVLSFGILIGTLSPNEISATYIALLLTTPQLFADKTYRLHLLTAVMDVIFICMVLKFKEPATWSSDIINALIFSAVSMLLSTFNTNTRVSRFLMEEKVRELAEIDQLTGLQNRNSYEFALAKAGTEAQGSVYCVYLDVNGLHEMNNQNGHEAGDRMLIYIAKQMQLLFGKAYTYRIGGDEFVAVGYDRSEAEIEKLVEDLRARISEAGYHAAIGYKCVTLSRIHIQNVVKDAEAMMYLDKKAYYELIGAKSPRMPSTC